MKFTYTLTGTGWSECSIEIDSQKCVFRPGYITDALGGLLQALVNINPLYTENTYIKHGSTLFWEEEPNGVYWDMRYVENGNMQLKIEYEDEGNDEEELKTVLYTECSYDVFLNEVLQETEKLLKEYGIVGYKEMWVDHDFPLANFLKLKYYAEQQLRFQTTETKVGYRDERRSDIEMEWNYLKGLLKK